MLKASTVPNPRIAILLRKIKDSMAAARGNNPEELPPLITAPAWVTGTQYAYGHVVTLGSPAVMAYNQNQSGAQAVTGASAPTLVNNGVQDNTTGPYWVPIYNTVAADTNNADLPVVTWTTTTTGLTQKVLNSGNNPLPIVRGVGCQLFGATNFGGIMSYQKSSPGFGLQTTFGGNIGNNVGNNFFSFEFMTDAPKFQITPLNGDATGAQQYVSYEINNRRLKYGSAQPIPATTTLGKNIQFDFTGAGAQARIPRKIRSYQQSNNSTTGIWIDSASTIWVPANPNRYRIFIEGDSDTMPVAPGSTSMAGVDPDLRWTKIFANLVGCDDCFNGATSAAGFITAASDGTTYINRLAQAILFAPDVLIVAGNYNDNSVDHPSITSLQRQSAINAYLQQARAALPNTIIILFGAQPGTYVSSQTAAMLALEADLLASVTAFNDPLTFYYSVLTDNGAGAIGTTTFSWFTGAGQVSATTGSGNNDVYVSSNNPHTTESAQIYLARRYATGFTTVINSIQI